MDTRYEAPNIVCIRKDSPYPAGKQLMEHVNKCLKKIQYVFTTGGLFYNESLKALALYLSLMDWKSVREWMLSDNLLQTRTKSSAVRICREICLRLETVTLNQLHLIESGTAQEQRYLMWIAVCKRYGFIREFMTEVLREKLMRMKRTWTAIWKN